jgi:hypothetical protein
MAIGALFVRSVRAPLPCNLLMAAFAVFMEGNVQLPCVTLSLGWIVTAGTLLDRLSFMPDVLAVLVFMVTLFAGFDITLCMLYMGEPNRSFAICSINFVFNEDLIGHLLRFSSF